MTAPKPPAPPPVVAPAPADLDSRLARWQSDAAAADARFADARPRAQTALAKAKGAARGTDAWSAANMALAELERERGAIGIILAELEQTFANDRISHAPETSARPEAAAIAKARQTVADLASAEDKVLDSLRSQLPG